MSDEDKTPLQAACSRLYDHFGVDNYPGAHPWISSIGIAEKGQYNAIAMIHVYLIRKPMHHEGAIPNIWEGYPVVSHVTGRMRLC